MQVERERSESDADTLGMTGAAYGDGFRWWPPDSSKYFYFGNQSRKEIGQSIYLIYFAN